VPTVVWSASGESQGFHLEGVQDPVVPASAGASTTSLKLTPSDPRLVAEAGELRDWSIPQSSLRYVQDGSTGPTSWTAITTKVLAALESVGLGRAYVADPKFEPPDPKADNPDLGYGYLVGEADLKRFRGFRLISSRNYVSFIATFQLWAAPPLAKGFAERPDAPHAWKVRVRAGRMLTSYVTGGRFGNTDYRMHWKPAPTEEGFGWVAPALLAQLK
jgi:hypothetical protein